MSNQTKHLQTMYRNFRNISRGLYVDFDPEKVACGLIQRAAYTLTYEY